jgi:UPF0716 protein FxsA
VRFPLLILFIVVPAVELALLIEIGRHIGVLATFGLIVGTGVLGVHLARQQGMQVLRQMQDEMASGRVPVGPLLDGILILLAGAVLITPGVLTDLFGFLCLLPGTRRIVKDLLRRRFGRYVRRRHMVIPIDADASAASPSAGADDPPYGASP